VVAPDENIERYGADTVRLYTLFLGAPEDDAEWTDSGVSGASKFLNRAWRQVHAIADGPGDGVVREVAPDDVPERALPLVRKAHWAIEKVSDDIQRRFHFNTAIAACMELSNTINEVRETVGDDPAAAPAMRFAAGTLTSLLQPFAPHVAEELWQALGGSELWREPWPVADERFLHTDTFTLVVQVNGKLRGRVEVPVGLDEAELLRRARAVESVRPHIEDGRQVVKEIVVPGKLVNLVVR